MVVCAGDEYVLLVLPASHRVDLERIEQILNTDVRMVTESEMKSLFPDCEVGAEPPFGSQFGLRTLVDEHLAQQERIAIRAGSHTEVVLLDYADYARLERPAVARFAVPE